METDSGKTTSVWMATAGEAESERLTGDTSADVCVIGAGIAGLSVAYHLTRGGKSVVVLDDGPVAGGETARTTAHLVNALDDRYYELERLHGERGARLAAESHTAAIDAIEAAIEEEGIDCDFERLDGYLFVAPGRENDELGEELRAAHRAGLTEVEYVGRVPYDGYNFGAALRFPYQGQFHILKYAAGLASAIRRGGGRIYTRAHADVIEGGADARVVTSEGFTVRAGSIVVATNTPVNDLVTIHTKQAPYRTYVIGVRVPAGSIPHMLLWDTEDPYHYIRLQTVKDDEGNASHDVLIVGGEDHKTGQADDYDERFRCLEEWTRERFKEAGAVEYRWSGQVMEPVDGLGFIGRNPGDADNVYIATGDSGNGMTHGTIAGLLISDLIIGRENEWATLYDPARLSLRAGVEYARENLNAAAQLTDYVTPGEVESADEVEAGSGAVVRRGLKKVAVYRDDSGALHEFSAVCVHLGCIVDWNDKEKTWDCPCHGSRYSPTDGHAVNGPAISGLGPAEE
jgi:glycine/D-amino acid oxidase-like deaminating enzyme/nitrite reductase/ring-hydroxylating ferredoxin subunit